MSHTGNGLDHAAGSSSSLNVTTDIPQVVNTNMTSTTATHEARVQMIARLAYLRAEARGFTPGYELNDWLSAEHEFNVRKP